MSCYWNWNSVRVDGMNEKIRGALKEKRLTQSGLAVMLCVTRATVSNRLNGTSPWRRNELIDVCTTPGIEIPLPNEIKSKEN